MIVAAGSRKLLAQRSLPQPKQPSTVPAEAALAGLLRAATAKGAPRRRRLATGLCSCVGGVSVSLQAPSSSSPSSFFTATTADSSTSNSSRNMMSVQ